MAIPTLTLVNNATGGIEDTAFGISYATLKGLANESAATDGFVLPALLLARFGITPEPLR
jgi:hypothetical protein